jgi:hypothetical protein
MIANPNFQEEAAGVNKKDTASTASLANVLLAMSARAISHPGASRSSARMSEPNELIELAEERPGPLHRSAVHMLPRRAIFATATAAAGSLLVPPMAAKAMPYTSWAFHDGPFEASAFEGMSKTKSGLEFRVVEAGKGDKPLAGQQIKAHYAGYLLKGTKFDASYDRRSPLQFKVGTGQVIKGWDEALLDMQAGEKRLLKIPPELGYGSRGAGGGVIPPDATLVFYVELVEIA